MVGEVIFFQEVPSYMRIRPLSPTTYTALELAPHTPVRCSVVPEVIFFHALPS